MTDANVPHQATENIVAKNYNAFGSQIEAKSTIQLEYRSVTVDDNFLSRGYHTIFSRWTPQTSTDYERPVGLTTVANLHPS